MGKIRSKWRALAWLSAVVFVLAAIPAIATHDTADPETLRLHLGSDGQFLVYSNGPVTQPIPAPDRCQASISGPLASITGSDRGTGLVGNSIGVKTGGSQGTPCSRVDVTEDLTISLLGVPAAGQVDLDLELKGSAKIKIETYFGGGLVGSFEVRSGGSIVAGEGVDGSAGPPFMATVTDAAPIANCKNASDSGPDSGGNDNCYVTVHPDTPFDAVKFVPLVGEMSLEGSGDFGNNPALDTIFYLTAFDGLLGCDPENNTVAFGEGDINGNFVRLENTDGSECVLKPFNIDVVTVDNEVVFTPVDNPGAPQPAAYQAELTFSPKPAENPFTSNLQYDQDDDEIDEFENMPWCTGDPFANPDAPGSIDTSVIPAGHTWCIVSSFTQVFDAASITTTWNVVGIGDPKLRG